MEKYLLIIDINVANGNFKLIKNFCLIKFKRLIRDFFNYSNKNNHNYLEKQPLALIDGNFVNL